MDEEGLPKQVLNWTQRGNRRIGRPKETYRRTLLHRHMRKYELNMEEMVELARDRGLWKASIDLWTALLRGLSK